MSLFYKQNAAARFFVDQTNGKVYEVVGGSAALLCWRTRFVTALLPKVVQALTDSYEAFRTDAIRFDRNVRYARNECRYPLAEYGFRRAASVLALSVRRKRIMV